MKKAETLEVFYERIYNKPPRSEELLFNILDYRTCGEHTSMEYRRCNFYKVTFLTGHYIIHYGDKSIEVNGTFLAFFHPDTPYTVETLGPENDGAFFIFRKAYLFDYYKSSIWDNSIFADRIAPIFLLDNSGQTFVDHIMKKMTAEMASDYAHKHDLIRGYIMELLHYSLKMQPTQQLYTKIDAKARVTQVFNELLDRQFPIESPDQPFVLRTPGEYAQQLGIHVNYLNKALRITTGKTTSQLIAERLISEAIALLKHSDWSIADICYSLGFEDPSHFNHFFKKQTEQTPSDFRRNIIASS